MNVFLTNASWETLFASKLKYIHHTIIKHHDDLPNQGRFLLQNDRSINLDGYICINCTRKFSRKDHLQYHQENDKNCRRELNLESENNQNYICSNLF